MDWKLTAGERRTLAVVLALIGTGYAVVAWRAWRPEAPPFALDEVDSLFFAQGRQLALDTLKAPPPARSAKAKTPAKKTVVRWPLDLNRADSLQLLELPGIGPSKVAAMLAWRRREGAFRQVEELLKVGGIGPVTLEKLRPKLVVKPAPGSGS